MHGMEEVWRTELLVCARELATSSANWWCVRYVCAGIIDGWMDGGTWEQRPYSDPLRSPTAAPGAEGVPAQSRGAVRTRLLARSGVENLESFRRQ